MNLIASGLLSLRLEVMVENPLLGLLRLLADMALLAFSEILKHIFYSSLVLSMMLPVL